jgi:hypothetical protein
MSYETRVLNNERDFFQKVYDATFEMSEAKICKKFSVSSAYAKHIAIRKLYNTTCYSRGTIGNKNDSYFTEDEMLNGFSCSVNDLSESELEIYNSI